MSGQSWGEQAASKHNHPRFFDRRAEGLALHHLHHDLKTVFETIVFFGVNIMSKISEFAEKQKAHNTKMGKAIDGLVEDVKTLNDKIAELQGTQGQLTPEDEALLAEIDAAAAGLADRLGALDDLTPPTPPTA